MHGFLPHVAGSARRLSSLDATGPVRHEPLGLPYPVPPSRSRAGPGPAGAGGNQEARRRNQEARRRPGFGLGGTRGYSPTTLQIRPIITKKPLNMAIRPMPP